jgi:hypothetical protein
MAHDIFICHSSRDREAVGKVLTAITSSGYSCWIAPRDIRPGHRYPEEIVDAIRHCQVMVLVYSSHSAESMDVGNEVAKAWRFQKPVIPFRVEDVPITDFLEYYIGHYQWIDAFAPPLASHFTTLVDSIEDLVHMKQTVAPLVVTDNAPAQVPEQQGSTEQSPAVAEHAVEHGHPEKPVAAAAVGKPGLAERAFRWILRFSDLKNPAPHRKIGAWSGLVISLSLAIMCLVIWGILGVTGGDEVSSDNPYYGIYSLFMILFLGAATLLPAALGFLALRRRAETSRKGVGKLKILWQANISMLKASILSSAVAFVVVLFFVSPWGMTMPTDLTGRLFYSLLFGIIIGPLMVAVFWCIPLLFTLIGGVLGLILPRWRRRATTGSGAR